MTASGPVSPDRPPSRRDHSPRRRRPFAAWRAARRILVALCSLVLLAVPAVATAQDGSESPGPPPGRPSTFDVVLAVHADTLADQDVALVVTDADGSVVLEHRASRALLPASTMKVLTAAAILDTLGPYRRITTRVRSAAPPDADGVVPNLVLVGAGDPALTTEAYRTHIYPARPSTSIEELADRVVAAGVEEVAGNVVGDGSAFGAQVEAAGWPPRYTDQFDARRISALTVDASVEVDTFPVDGFERLIGQRLAPHPELHAAWEFAQALRDRGVTIGGRVRMAGVPIDAPHQVAWIASPPVEDLVTFMLERSDNHLADTLVRTAGLQAEGIGTWSAGGRAVAAALADLEVDTTGLVVDDGSGLSRLDRVTPTTLASADRALLERFGKAWTSWLSTAGEDGTLQGRLRGTSADGRFHGKTGSLQDVRARVGHVQLGRDRMFMAIIGNDLGGGQTWRVTVLADDLALAMTDHLQGCTRVPRDQPSASPSPSPSPSASPSASGSPENASDGPSDGPAVLDPDSLPEVPLSDGSAWRRVCPDS